MENPQATPLRLILTLGTAGLLSGLILVSVYLLTRPTIERNQAQALEKAIYRVVPGAVSRKAFILLSDRLVPEQSDSASAKNPMIFAAYDEQGNLLGYAIPAEGAGFQDTIRLIYGFDPEQRRITGMEVLESRETPGLGDKIVKDENFLADFRGLQIEPRVELVRPGEKTAPNQVDSISGATISSRAVVQTINEANRRWVPLIAPDHEVKAQNR